MNPIVLKIADGTAFFLGLLLELPLYPFRNGYGAAQRRVARMHGLPMLPKRCFASVFATHGGTLDGLHLAQPGHDALARILAEVLVVE